MAAATSPKKSSGPVGVQSMKSSGGLWFLVVTVALALLVTLGFALFFGDSSDTPSTGKPEVKPATITKSLTVELRPDGWTRWITEIPPGAPYVVDSPGWHRYDFWNKEQRVVEKPKPGERPKWLGTVPHCVFRLKGAPGAATVYWDVVVR